MKGTFNMATLNKTIALLATGDEIKNGDIVNTDAQEIAKRLFENGMTIGIHLVVGDQTIGIESAIHFLLQSHTALIITGGLGPTSDDLTRFALANALKRELIFDETTWNQIDARLKTVGYTKTPENNRQQALFPKNAEIIPNSSGTAAGCVIEENDKIIFMLPGPPYECLPMVDHIVIPRLKTLQYSHLFYYQKWLLFSVSEGHIAESLDAITKNFDCTTGYRLAYPYVEFKMYSHQEKDFQALLPKVLKIISPYLILDGSKPASEFLKEKILSLRQPITILDQATGGLLETLLVTPETHQKIYFDTKQSTAWQIEISGLTAYWENINTTQAHLDIIFKKHNIVEKSVHKDIPFRGSRVKQYAVEYICREILACNVYLSS